MSIYQRLFVLGLYRNASSGVPLLVCVHHVASWGSSVISGLAQRSGGAIGCVAEGSKHEVGDHGKREMKTCLCY